MIALELKIRLCVQTKPVICLQDLVMKSLEKFWIKALQRSEVKNAFWISAALVMFKKQAMGGLFF